jgi:hypothetical protein
MEKKIGNKVWFNCGRTNGFYLGFLVNKDQLNFDFGFWYIGFEY